MVQNIALEIELEDKTISDIVTPMGIFCTTRRKKTGSSMTLVVRRQADANIFKDILWIRSEKYEI